MRGVLLGKLRFRKILMGAAERSTLRWLSRRRERNGFSFEIRYPSHPAEEHQCTLPESVSRGEFQGKPCVRNLMTHG